MLLWIFVFSAIKINIKEYDKFAEAQKETHRGDSSVGEYDL